MKILIFGTGSAAGSFIEECEEYFKNIEILAFVDNNIKKIGNKFKEKIIISPENIFKYNYDAILICSTYEEDIYQQLIIDIKIYEENIYTRRTFFEHMIFPWYNKKYDLYNKKILIFTEDYGTEIEYNRYFGLYYNAFNIVGVIGLNEDYLIKNYDFDYIFITNFKPPSVYDIKNSYIKLEKLKNKYKVLTFKIINIFFINIRKMCYGNDYEDKKFLIIRCNKFFQGLGSIALFIARSIQFAAREGYIPVVDMKIPRFSNDECEKENVYTKFFKQPDVYNLDDIENAKSVSVIYARKWLSKKDSNELIFPKMQDKLYAKYFKFKKQFNNKRVLGVLFRGTDYANLKPFRHYIQPDLPVVVDMAKKKIEEWGDFDLIFLCTEVQEACECFEAEFGKEKVYYYPQLRYTLDTKKYLADINISPEEHIQQEQGYWIALNLLASCHSIIAGRCTGTGIAMIINNNNYKNSYLFDLGRYGIDDI